MKILVLEDEALFLDTVLIILEEMGYSDLYSADNSREALDLFVKLKPDLVLMDIHIKGPQDGIEVAQVINKSEKAVPIIFMTSLEDTQTFDRAKMTNPINYLVKPFEDADLKRSIELAIYKFYQATWDSELFSSETNEDILAKDSFFIKQGKTLKKVHIETIIYIQSSDKYVKLLLEDRRMLVRMSLNELNHKLPSDIFTRINRSIIINIHHVSDIDLATNMIILNNGERFMISRHYRDTLLKRLNIIQ